MRRSKNKGKLRQRYFAWRKKQPLGIRIAADLGAIVTVVYLAVFALQVLILLLPLLFILGLAKSNHSSADDQKWMDENDPRGGGHSNISGPVSFD